MKSKQLQTEWIDAFSVDQFNRKMEELAAIGFRPITCTLEVNSKNDLKVLMLKDQEEAYPTCPLVLEAGASNFEGVLNQLASSQFLVVEGSFRAIRSMHSPDLFACIVVFKSDVEGHRYKVLSGTPENVLQATHKHCAQYKWEESSLKSFLGKNYMASILWSMPKKIKFGDAEFSVERNDDPI